MHGYDLCYACDFLGKIGPQSLVKNTLVREAVNRPNIDHKLRTPACSAGTNSNCHHKFLIIFVKIYFMI